MPVGKEPTNQGKNPIIYEWWPGNTFFYSTLKITLSVDVLLELQLTVQHLSKSIGKVYVEM